MDNGLRFLEMIRTLPSPASSVSFHFLKAVSLTDRTRLKRFLIGLVKAEKKCRTELSFVFCSDDHLLEMNQQFLNHDYYTDILTFPLDSPKGYISGEMYLSIDRIRDNARTLGIPISRELHRVIFHGVLHLCGYKDKSTAAVKKMRSREDFYLKRYFR